MGVFGKRQDMGTLMGNGEIIMRSSSDVSEDTPQLAQDGARPGASVRLPPAPQLVMVSSQGAGPVAIEIQPSQPHAAPTVQQAQIAPTVQHAQVAATVQPPRAAPNVQQSRAAAEIRQSQAAVQQPRAAATVQPPRAAPNVQQSRAAAEVRQSQAAVQQSRAAATVQQPQAVPNVRQSQVAPEVRQSRAASSAQLAWIASGVRPSEAPPIVDQSQLEPSPDLQAAPIRSVTVHDIVHESGRARVSLFTKFLGTAAVVSCGLVAAWAIGSMFFSNAPKDEVRDPSQMEAAAPQDVSAEREQAPSDNSQSATVSTPATQVEQATYVVANTSPTAQPQPQNDQQQPRSQALIEQQQPPQQRPNEQQTTPLPQQVSNDQAEPPRPQQKSEISLSAEEVERLTNLGEKMLAQGDLATARRLLEHAAQARGARAALLLGATYDPDGLRKMGAVGVRPDLEKAHMWYARAAEFGSSEASHRLAGLGQRSH
jgi:hypothetical protein